MDFLVQGGGVVDRCAAFGNIGDGEYGMERIEGRWRRSKGDIAALDHEAWDEAVEGGVIVCAGGAEGEEVLW